MREKREGDGGIETWGEGRKRKKKRRREGKQKKKEEKREPDFLMQTPQVPTDNTSFNPPDPKSLHMPHEGGHPQCSDFMA